jgi:small-conductance mechanosensitive channel
LDRDIVVCALPVNVLDWRVMNAIVPKRRGRNLAALLLSTVLVAALLAPAPGGPAAQTPNTKTTQPEPTPPPEEPKGPQPIPASQISIKSEETAEVLRSMRERPDPDPEIEAIRQALPKTLGVLQDLLGETENRIKGTVSSRTLEDLERRWSRHRQRVEGWQSTVNRRARALDRDLETLLDLRASWEITQEGAAEAGLQEALLEVVNNSLESIREVESKFDSRRSELLSVQGQVEEAAEVIRNARDQIDSARDKTRLKLAHLDARPLWDVIADPPPRVQHWRHLVIVWEESKRDFNDFLDSYRNPIIVHLLALVALVIAFILLKPRVRKLDLDGPELAASARVISRPISAALTLWLLWTMIVFPEAPQLVDEVATLVLFVPLYRILPARIVSSIPGLLATLVVVNIIGRFVDLLTYMSPLYRLALLFESLVIVTTIAVSMRKTRGVPGERRSPWIRLIRAVQWIGLTYMSAATVANVVGNVSFAGTVARSVYLSAYLGLALYAVYFVAVGLVHLALRSRFFQHLQMVRKYSQLVRDRLLTLLWIGLLVYWAVTSLQLLQMLSPVVEFITRILTAEAKFGDVGLSLGGILSFAVTVWAAVLLSRLIRFILQADVFPRLTLPRGVSSAVSIGIHYALLLLGFFLAVAATGADLGKTTILAGAFGVGVGFGLQDIVNNFVSGLILVVERPILPGDSVQIENLFGEVKRIGLRSSTVRTWEGAEVIVPNGKLISSQVINWTLSDRQRRLDVHVGVEYGNDPEQVVDILVRSASNLPGLLQNPEPMALFLGFGDYTLDFQLRTWTAESGWLKIHSELRMAVNKALKDAGINIPFPKRDLRLLTGGDDAWDQAPNKEISDEP